jgi:hypothetical protein
MVKFLQLVLLLTKFGLLSLISKENQKKKTKVNSISNRISNSLIPALPISYSTLFFILVFSTTSVYCQKKEQAKPRSENAIERQKTSIKADLLNTNEKTDKSAVSTSPTQGSTATKNNTTPPNFDINAVSDDVRQQLDENKKNGRPFFEGISQALEFELMNSKVSESDLISRIEKSKDAQTPIQIKKKGENLYWIITDTNTSTTSIKEMVSTAGFTVNFISKSYRLK